MMVSAKNAQLATQIECEYSAMAVHPNCLVNATADDVKHASLLVALIYHALVVCEEQKIAAFKDSPHDALKLLEMSGKRPLESGPDDGQQSLE